MLLSFIFSFRNEEENIPELMRRVDAVGASIDDVLNICEDCFYTNRARSFFELLWTFCNL
jgi:hypothetical protein